MRLRQVAALTAIGLRSIPQRIGGSMVIVIGTAIVVAVLISVLAMRFGFARTIGGDVRPDRVIVLSRGVDSESNSGLTRENVAILAAAPGVARNSKGGSLLSAEVVLVAPVARRDGADAYITLRGIGAQAFDLRPELKLVSGRMFKSGVHELIVGAAAHAQFAGLDVGSRVRLPEGDWTVVGVFSGGDSVRESEVLADAETVMAAYKLDGYNAATALLAGSDALPTLKDALSHEPSMKVDVLPEGQYLEMSSRSINRLLRAVALVIGTIMTLGAVFGALNTMYSSVAARMPEVATLRALGFGSSELVASILIEALLLALLGAALGIAIAYLAFDGRAISTLGGSRWDSQLVYSLEISTPIVSVAAALACIIGLIGGSFPAIRATKTSVAEALQRI
jgi:putative ABC transport system permease protein